MLSTVPQNEAVENQAAVSGLGVGRVEQRGVSRQTGSEILGPETESAADAEQAEHKSVVCEEGCCDCR